jgi:hypothetical protein
VIKRYDPLDVPAPEEWLDTDEAERLRLVERYHRRARVRLPNTVVHATLHVIVENQAALGDEIPVHGTLDRLMKEGIDRHEAIHAVAAVLAEHMAHLVRSGGPSQSDPNARYYAALKKLTVESWRQTYG